jgi:proteasome lid subunit RPN8/RPN11
MTIAFRPTTQTPLGSDPASAAARLRVSAPVSGPVYVWADGVEGAMWSHARSSSIEVAGILAGRAWVSAEREQAVVSIDAAIPAERHVETSSTHVTFKDDAWGAISSELDAFEPGTIVVGWYHTHPNLGAFFSGTDRATQARAFRQPWQVGVVLDPVRRELLSFRGMDCLEVPPNAHVQPGPAPALPRPAQPTGAQSARGARRRLAWAAAAAIIGALLVAALHRRSLRDTGEEA